MVRSGWVLALAVAACSPTLKGGPGHHQWQSAGGGPASARVVVGSRYDPTGRVDGYFQGDRRLTLEQFLRVTGHHPQADRIATRRWLKPTLIGVGAAVIIVGAAYSFIVPSCSLEDGTLDEYNQCLQERNDQRIHGGGIAVGGAAVAATGLVLGTGRPGAEELRHWAAEHNRAHGIPPIAGAPARVRIGTAIDRHGAGLVVSGRF